MTTPTDDRPDLLTVVATMRAEQGRTDDLRAALVALLAPTQAEAGCVNYDLQQSVEDPAEFAFHENWESAQHLDDHLGAPHLTAFAARTGDLLDGPLVIRRMHRVTA